MLHNVLYKKIKKNKKNPPLTNKKQKEKKKAISVIVERITEAGVEWNKKEARKDAEGYNRTVI